MGQRSVWWWSVVVGTLASACGGSSPPPAQANSEADEAVLRDPVLDAVVNDNATRSPTHGTPTDHRAEPIASNGAAPSPGRSSVGVRGITGSLTAFEVDEAMNTRADALMACVRQRPNRLGHVAGEIKFHVAIDGQGKVERVRVTQSDIGHPPLERCLAEVVATAPFPAPAGAQGAEATWQMIVDPLGRGAEVIDPAELDDAMTEQAEAAYEACSVERHRKFNVTGYLSRSGALTPVSVLNPWRGAARTPEDAAEELDCLAAALTEWKYLPKPARVTKATFELRFIPKPEEPRARRKKKNKRRNH